MTRRLQLSAVLLAWLLATGSHWDLVQTVAWGATAATNRRRNERVVVGSPSYALDYDEVSPKLGLRWDGNDVQVYANVSGSYEPSSFSET